MTSATSTGGTRPVRRRDGFLAAFWLHGLFFLARHAPIVLRLSRPMWVDWGWRSVKAVRRNLLANAARLLGSGSTYGQRTRLARGVIESFYLFVMESAECTALSREQIEMRIASVENIERYRELRTGPTGVIIATAHMGSFEVALAALSRHEPRVHVIFQRDLFSKFNRVRSLLRGRMGIIEHELDGGWPMWMELREALARNEVVLMQADRALPGQKAQLMPFLGGHIRVPTGPARLAAISGAPIVPVFTVRQSDGRIRVKIEQPVVVDAGSSESRQVEEGTRKLTACIERQVAAHPDQWLMVQKVFVEDQETVGA